MIEYKHLTFQKEEEIEPALNEHAKDGWQIHTFTPVLAWVGDVSGLVVSALLIRIKVEPEPEQGARNFIGKDEAMRIEG